MFQINVTSFKIKLKHIIKKRDVGYLWEFPDDPVSADGWWERHHPIPVILHGDLEGNVKQKLALSDSV